MMKRELYPLMMNEEILMNVTDDDTEIMNPDLLQVAKEEVQAISESEGTVVAVGTLKELAPALTCAGAISPQARLESGVITQEQIDAAHESIARQYVPVTEGAPIRCGDGRGLAEYDPEDAELYGRVLGPQLFGASYGLALSHRIAVGGVTELDETETTVVNDIKTVDIAAVKAGFNGGAHTDIRNCNGGEKCGCGAIDTTNQQFNRLSDSAQVNGAQQLTQARLGDRYSQKHFDIALASALELRTETEKYLVASHDVLNAVKEDSPGSVEILSLSHNETELVVNSVRGTTLHRDELAAETDGEVEAFGTDDWALWEIAAELYPEDTETQSIFVHAFMIKDGVTLPGLIAEDGSIHISVRQPVAA